MRNRTTTDLDCFSHAWKTRRLSPIPEEWCHTPASTNQGGTMIKERAGYQIVRVVHSDDVATDYLARRADGAEFVIVKEFHASADSSTVRRVCSGFTCVTHPHVHRMIDIASATGPHPLVVLERLSNLTLASLRVQGYRPTPGQLLTLVAPVVAAVEALHANGATHGAIALRTIRFSPNGAPVLVHVEGAEQDSRAARLADQRALSGVVRELFEAVVTTNAEEQAHIDAVMHELNVLEGRIGRGPETLYFSKLLDVLFAHLVATSLPEELLVERVEGTPERGGSTRGDSSIGAGGFDWNHYDHIDIGPEIPQTRAQRVIEYLGGFIAIPRVIERHIDLRAERAAHRIRLASTENESEVKQTSVTRRHRSRLLVVTLVLVTVIVAAALLLIPQANEATSVPAAPLAGAPESSVPSAQPSSFNQESQKLDPAEALREILRQNGIDVGIDQIQTQQRLGGSALIVVSAEHAQARYLLVLGENGWRIRETFPSG